MVPDPTFGADYFDVADAGMSWEYLWGKTPEANLKRFLLRINREPHQVGFREAGGHVVAFARTKADPKPQPFALIFLGLSLDEANEVKHQLRLTGWTLEEGRMAS